MLITNSPAVARAATDAGVERIFVDLEKGAKEERQKGRKTVISDHTIDDVRAIREAVPNAELLVRLNEPAQLSRAEVEAVLREAPDVVMLPMFRSQTEIEWLVERVAGRARVCGLFETPQALARLESILEDTPGLDEVFLGLNDLHIGLGLDFMFEVLAGGLVEHAAAVARRHNRMFGFGGIGRIGCSELPVPADVVLGEHVRLRSQAVILSRAFSDGLTSTDTLAREVGKIRERELHWKSASDEDLQVNARALRRFVAAIPMTSQVK